MTDTPEAEGRLTSNLFGPAPAGALVDEVPCPFVYASGKRCTGHITHVEAYKADLCWGRDRKTNEWKLSVGQPRSHYHLFCSEKSNHAGYSRPDSPQMKLYFDQLPEELRKVIGS